VGIAVTGFCYLGEILQIISSTRLASFAAADGSINWIASSRLISFGSSSTSVRHRQSLLRLWRCGRQDQHHEDQEEKSKLRKIKALLRACVTRKGKKVIDKIGDFR
jgi:hypothetical protein